MRVKQWARKGVAGAAAIAIGLVLLAIGATSVGAAITVAGIVDLASDGIVLLARFATRRMKARYCA